MASRTVTRTCDECGNRFEIREDIAVDVDAWAEQGDPYVCGDCLSNDPYADDCIASELEDAFDARAERFPNGVDPLVEFRVGKE